MRPVLKKRHNSHKSHQTIVQSLPPPLDDACIFCFAEWSNLTCLRLLPLPLAWALDLAAVKAQSQYRSSSAQPKSCQWSKRQHVRPGGQIVTLCVLKNCDEVTARAPKVSAVVSLGATHLEMRLRVPQVLKRSSAKMIAPKSSLCLVRFSRALGFWRQGS